VPKRLRRADEGEPALFLLGKNLDLDPGDLLDLLDRLLAVLRIANRRCRNRADGLGAKLLRELDLGGNDLPHLRDLLFRQLAIALRVGADLRVGALLHDLPKLALLRLGNEHARRVRADVDRGAEHQSSVADPQV
jgi:hypothetical protein